MNTRTFASQITTGAFVSLLSLVFAKGINLVRTIVVARLLSTADFGLFSLLFSFFYLALNLAVFGFPATSAKYMASLRGRRNDIKHFLINLYFLASGFALIVGVGVFLLADIMAVQIYQEPSLGLPLRWMGGAVFFQSLFMINMALLQGLSLYIQRSMLEIMDALLGLSLMIFLTSHFSVAGAALAFFLGGIGSFVISSLVLSKAIEYGKSEEDRAILSLETLKKILKFAFPVFLTVILVYFFSWMGDILLKRYSSHIEQVGWMYIARSLGQVVLFIPVAMSVPLLPVISSESKRGGEEIACFLQISWFLSFVIGIVIGAMSKIVIPFLFGNHYSSATYAVFLYSIASIPMAMTTSIFSAILTGKGYIWPLTAFNILWGCMFIGLSRVFLPYLEIEGAMYAYMLSYVFLAVMIGVFIKKRGISSGITGGLLLYFLGSIIITAFLLLRLEGTAYGLGVVIWIPIMIALGLFLLGKDHREIMIKRILSLFRITERRL